jgi:hypothetical protein
MALNNSIRAEGVPHGILIPTSKHSKAKAGQVRNSELMYYTRVYTTSLLDHGANFDHKLNLNYHKVFNIIKVELQFMTYQFNKPLLLFR